MIGETISHYRILEKVGAGEGSYAHRRLVSNYAVSPETGRFIMVKPDHPSDTTELRVVRNWLHEIRGILP